MCDIFKLEKHIQEQGFRGIKKGDITSEQSLPAPEKVGGTKLFQKYPFCPFSFSAVFFIANFLGVEEIKMCQITLQLSVEFFQCCIHLRT